MLKFETAAVQARLGVPYRGALVNLLRTNTVPYGTDARAAYNQTGLLTASPGTFFRAGAGYAQPWTRDASVNSWSAGSLLAPGVARNTLWSVVRRGAEGHLIVQQDNQWWDQVIWIEAAWNHYLVTGDRAFLRDAYDAAEHTLTANREAHFNAEQGLFEGPAFLNDGIAGYPAPPADATESRGSFVLDYPGADKVMALSTNCLYVAAFRAAAAMAVELKLPANVAARWNEAADALASRIRERFWMTAAQRYGYLISADGKLEPYQEGSGLAFALLFGVATPEQATVMLRSAHEEPAGMPDVWPAFARYDADRPRTAQRGDMATDRGAVGGGGGAMRQCCGVCAGGGNAGAAGGCGPQSLLGDLQQQDGCAGRRLAGGARLGFGAGPDMVCNGIPAHGLRRAVWDAVSMPAGCSLRRCCRKVGVRLSLTGLQYRQAVLTVHLGGAGTVVRNVRIDGITQKVALVPAGLQGRHVVEIEMAER